MSYEEPESIRYTADVVCVRGDEVLLIERGWPPFEGMLALPGGHVDKGETAREAAVRELAEETGVFVPADSAEIVMLGVFDAPGRDPRGRYVDVAYLIRVPESTRAVAGDDARSVRWVFIDGAPTLAFDHNEIINAARTHLATVKENRATHYPAADPGHLRRTEAILRDFPQASAHLVSVLLKVPEAMAQVYLNIVKES